MVLLFFCSRSWRSVTTSAAAGLLLLSSSSRAPSVSAMPEQDPPLGAVSGSMLGAVTDQMALYETLHDVFVDDGCSESWGAFPSQTSSSTTNSFVERVTSMTMKHQGAACNCGMLANLGATALQKVEVFQALLAEELARDDDDKVDAPSSPSTPAVVATDHESNASSDSSSTTTKNHLPPHHDDHSSSRKLLPGASADCVDGFAHGFPCHNVHLVAHLPLQALNVTNAYQPSGNPILANDLWGWTDVESGREFVVWGVGEGTFFLEITPEDGLIVLGYLPAENDKFKPLHDVKVLGHYAYLGAEIKNHGIQVLDLRRLLAVDPATDCTHNGYCQVFQADAVYTHSTDTDLQDFPVGKTHNLVVNPDNPTVVYAVGGSNEFGNACGGGLQVIDVSDPLHPFTITCFADAGYVHDAHCVTYHGPDVRYAGREICVAFNANVVVVLDVTSKSDIAILSVTEYNDTGYTHQGWLSSDHSHVVFGDEYDELMNLTDTTRTLVMNIEDLEHPTNVRKHFHETTAVDHNLYVVAATAPGQNYDASKYANTDLVYQANYRAGLRILQVLDYETADLVEVGYFDTVPDDSIYDGIPDGEGNLLGAFSTYPYFASGLVAVSSVLEGLFLVKPALNLCGDAPASEWTHKQTPGKDCAWLATKPLARQQKVCQTKAAKSTKSSKASKVHGVCQATCHRAGNPKACPGTTVAAATSEAIPV